MTDRKRAAKNDSGVSLWGAIGAMHLELDEFAHDWLRRRQKDPDNYPIEYPSQEEWEDQFRAWVDIKSEDQ